MHEIDTAEKERIEIAQVVSEEIQRRFNLSLFEISLNTINENIQIKLNPDEADRSLLNAIESELSIKYQSRYIYLSAQILSGSFMDNLIKPPVALYLFEKV